MEMDGSYSFQAIIKIDQDGFFSLKNLGKCSISINSKDVAPGHCLRLNSGCIIEVCSSYCKENCLIYWWDEVLLFQDFHYMGEK